jgi:LysR family transcriptional regulator, low CO2-responsive transcriptional regulator
MSALMTCLRAFHEVATHKSFTGAARALNVTQPTLSAHVRALEVEHRVSLFDRRRGGMRLSDDGRELFALTGQIFELEARASALLSATHKLGRGQLRVAADAPVHVIPAVAALRRVHPELRVTVSIGNSQQVLASLLAHDSDVAVLAEVADVVARARTGSRLHAQPIKEDRVVLVVPVSHRWARAKKKAVRLRELAGEPLVMREEGSTTRAILDSHLAARKVSKGPILELGSREAVREAVAAGLGVGAVFDSEMGHDARLRKIAVSDAALRGTEYLVCLEQRREHVAVRAFVAAVTGKLA